MLIGNPKWFGRRKYSGWGIAPRTWQGWVYIAVFMLILVGFHILPFWNNTTRIVFTTIWAAVLIVDTFNIMLNLRNDEREKIHEAIAERNALWAVLVVLIVGIMYDVIQSGLNQTIYVNPFLIAALVIALIVKAISNVYLDRNN